MSARDDAVLCYVDGPWLWFTTTPLADQTGGDWDDAPYEHNAGDPCEWLPYDDRQVPRYELFRMAVVTTMKTPAGRANLNSPWSVEQINRGETPWLWASDEPLPACPRPRFGVLFGMRGGPPQSRIWAGETYASVKAALLRRGDRVFEEVERP